MKEIIESIVEDTKNGKAVTIVASTLMVDTATHIFRSALMRLRAWDEYRSIGYLTANVYENEEHQLRLIVLHIQPGDDGYLPYITQPSQEYMRETALRYVEDSDKLYTLEVGVNIVG